MKAKDPNKWLRNWRHRNEKPHLSIGLPNLTEEVFDSLYKDKIPDSTFTSLSEKQASDIVRRKPTLIVSAEPESSRRLAEEIQHGIVYKTLNHNNGK